MRVFYYFSLTASQVTWMELKSAGGVSENCYCCLVGKKMSLTSSGEKSPVSPISHFTIYYLPRWSLW